MGDELDLTVAKDEWILAQRAVAALETEHAARIRDVEALDSTLLAAWTRLTGTREARIDAAIRAVKQAEQQLSRARANLERVRGDSARTVAALEQKKADAAAAAKALAERLSALADEVGERGDAVRSRLLERDLLRDRLHLLEVAALAGSAVLSSLTTVLGSARRPDDRDGFGEGILHDGAHGYDGTEQISNAIERAVQYGTAQQGLSKLPGRLTRFKEALVALGEVPDLNDVAHDPLFEALFVSRLTEQIEDCKEIDGRARVLMVPVDRERREVGGRLKDLDAELASLAAA